MLGRRACSSSPGELDGRTKDGEMDPAAGRASFALELETPPCSLYLVSCLLKASLPTNSKVQDASRLQETLSRTNQHLPQWRHGTFGFVGSDNSRLAAHHAGSGKVDVAGNKWLFSWYIVRTTQRTGIHINKLAMNQSVYHQFIVKTDNKTRVFYHNLTYMKLQYTFSEYRIGMISFV